MTISKLSFKTRKKGGSPLAKGRMPGHRPAATRTIVVSTSAGNVP
jgi:hypothetical protein